MDHLKIHVLLGVLHMYNLNECLVEGVLGGQVPNRTYMDLGLVFGNASWMVLKGNQPESQHICGAPIWAKWTTSFRTKLMSKRSYQAKLCV